MTLQEMLRTIWFGKWLVLVALLAAGAGAWFYLSGQEPEYAAEATVQIVDAETLTTAGIRLEGDPSLATSDEVAAAAASALGAGVSADHLAAHTSAEHAADSATTVTVTATGADPEATVAAANAMAAAYVAALQDQFDTDLSAMQDRLDVLAGTIDKQQQAITRARAATAAAAGNAGTGDAVDGLLGAQYSGSMEQYQTLAAQQAQARALANPALVLRTAVNAQLVSLPASLVVMIAALAGLLVGVALAMFRRGLDTRVRTPGAAQRAASAPVLARLSGTAVALRTWESEAVLPVATREATAYTRSVRELRTAVQAAMENAVGGAVIVVTSADLATPRSFVAANLAASWALSGRSVAVLSGDLRQPRLNDLLPTTADPDAEPGPGGVLPTTIPHLAVHPALHTELDPADFLASDLVRGLIDELRATTDVVVIDAPPMLVAADATILGAYADGVLLAATLGHTRIGVVEESADRLRAAHARLLGLSLDGAAAARVVAYEATYAYAGAQGDGAAADEDAAVTQDERSSERAGPAGPEDRGAAVEDAAPEAAAAAGFGPGQGERPGKVRPAVGAERR